MKEHILLIGAGKRAEEFLDKTQNLYEMEEAEYVIADIFYTRKERWLREQKVLDLKEVDMGYFDRIFIAKDVPMSINGVIQYLHHQGMREVSIYDGQCMKTIDLQGKPVLGYVEMHLVNHCNLNCAGCSHFANIQEEKYYSEAHIQEEFVVLSQKFHILTIRLMGGEPLLHPNVTAILRYARMSFFDSRIELVTNGIHLPKMAQEFWQAVKQNGIIISVSNYEPTFRMAKDLIKLFEKYETEYAFDLSCKQPEAAHVVKEFHKCLSKTPCHDKQIAARVCYGKNCYFFHDFYLTKCVFPALIWVLNENYGTEFRVDKKDFHDVRLGTDGWEILDKLEEPMEFCRYCIEEKPERIKWTTTKKAVLEDYIVCEK